MAMAALRFLADESCDFAVVRSLRGDGYDVLAVAEFMTRSDDAELMEQAHLQGRVLLTEDRDFGRLVFVRHAASAGVILIRFPGDARSGLASAVLRVVQERGEGLSGSFAVIQPGQIRIAQQP